MRLAIHEYLLTWEQLNREDIPLTAIYERLPGFLGFDPRDSVPYWYGKGGDAQFLCASAEPAGLMLEGILDETTWKEWLASFCTMASGAFGERIGPNPEFSETKVLSG